MDKELLVGRVIFPEMIDAGSSLVQAIEESSLHLQAAFWFQESVDSNWRLIFAFPEVRLDGPRSVYKKVKSISKKMPSDSPRIKAEDVSVVDDKDPFVSTFKSAIKVDGGGVRFSRNYINGLYIEDSYIYKMV